VADKEALVNGGLNPGLLEDLRMMPGALRYAVGEYVKVLNNLQWTEESAKAFELLDSLIHTFLFAYRNNEKVLQLVHAAIKGNSIDQKIQQMENISAIGGEYPEELKEINFDSALLDQAAEYSARLGNLLGEMKAGRAGQAKKTRDQAYTLLRKIMGEVREFGKYVFYRNEDRLQGYASAYNRKRNRKTTGNVATLETPEVSKAA
jgi:hypothetical protein